MHLHAKLKDLLRALIDAMAANFIAWGARWHPAKHLTPSDMMTTILSKTSRFPIFISGFTHVLIMQAPGIVTFPRSPPAS